MFGSMEPLNENIPITSKNSNKTIGFLGAFSIIVGCMVGAGIFMNVGPTMKATPPSVGFLIIYWTIGGLISLIGGLCYAELGALIPKSGGERTYLAEFPGYRFGVTFTYVYVYISKSIMFAALSITIGKYFVEMFQPNCDNMEIPAIIIAYAVLLTTFILNVLSKNLANNIQIVFTITKILALTVIIITGFISMAKGNVKPFKDPFNVSQFNPMLLGTVFINVLWSHEGWNGLGAIVGEMANPVRDLPLAIGSGVIVVILLYTSTIVAYISVLGYEQVSNSETVAVLFAEKMYGRFGFIISFLICCSSFGACNGGMMSVARVSLMSGYEGEIPRIFSLLHRTQRTPVVSLFSILLFSCIYVPTRYEVLLEYSAIVSWIFYFLVMSSLIYFKIKRKDLVAKFRVPILFPFLIQLVSLYMVFMAFYNNFYGCCCLLAIIMGIFTIHWLPDGLLKPRILVKSHNRVCDKLKLWFDLEFAKENDIS